MLPGKNRKEAIVSVPIRSAGTVKPNWFMAISALIRRLSRPGIRLGMPMETCASVENNAVDITVAVIELLLSANRFKASSETVIGRISVVAASDADDGT